MSDETSSGPINRTVTVAGVESKSGGADTDRPWTKYALVDERGNRQSTFDKKIGMFLQSSIGKLVEIEVEKDGRYWNLLSAKPADGPAPVAKSNSNGNGGGYGRDPENELHIAREAALHAVTRLHSGANTDIDSILILADRAVRWIYGGLLVRGDPSLVAVVPEKPVDVADRIAAEVGRLSGEGRPSAAYVTTRVAEIRFKPINGGSGKRFTVYTSGDEIYYTFSETIARTLRQAKDEQAMVTCLFHKTEFGNEIDEVAEVKGGPIRGEPVTVPS